MTVHFVGAGPGAADLLTVRATRLLAAADVVLYPGTYLDPEVLGHVSPGAALTDTQHLDLDQITAQLVAAHAAGKEVVRLASGDLSLYSALAEQTRRLDESGVPWDVTPGVPAYAAAAALAGRELTVPLVAQSVVLTRAQARSTAMPETESLAAFAATKATLVLHLAITRTRALMAELEPHYGPDCPVVVVYRASQEGELLLRGTVATIAGAVEEAGLRQAAVILVGQALAPREAGDSHLYAPARVRRRSGPIA
jgi:precorrin-4/cobalt-precorrin-4 C11-methyltransferase